MTQIRRRVAPLMVLTVLAIMLGPTIWRRTHRHPLYVCIGGCDILQFQKIKDALASDGIPLRQGISDVEMTSLMVPQEYKQNALSAIRRWQLVHPNFNVDLIDEANVGYHFIRYVDEVKDTLRLQGIRVLPEYVDNGIVFVKVRWKDKDQAVSVLQQLQRAHPEYGLEIPTTDPPSLKLMSQPNPSPKSIKSGVNSA